MQKIGLSILVAAAIFFLWDTPFVYPFKLLVVFLHETSHVIATILTGGHVVEMAIVQAQGGHVVSNGGWPFMIYSAGYLGSLILGGLIFTLANTTKAHKITMAVLGILMILIALLFVRNLFGFFFSVMLGGGLFAIGRYLSAAFSEALLRIMGVTSILYVPYDIYSDTIARSYLNSDARMLAEAYGGTTWFWGGIWLVISLVVIVLLVRWTIKSAPPATPPPFDVE